MNKSIHAIRAGSLVAVLALASACGIEGDNGAEHSHDHGEPGHTHEAEPAEEATWLQQVRRYSYDFAASQGPAELSHTVDLAVAGTIIGLSDGPATADEPGEIPYQRRTVMDVRIDEVLSGETSEKTIQVQIDRGPLPRPGGEAIGDFEPLDPSSFERNTEAEMAEARAAVPSDTVVLFLEEVSYLYSNADMAERTTDPNNGRDTARPIYQPYADGFWFNTPSGLAGAWADVDELPTGWKKVATLSDIREAARI